MTVKQEFGLKTRKFVKPNIKQVLGSYIKNKTLDWCSDKDMMLIATHISKLAQS